MIDGLTLDQLRTFLAAADQGSFSAAGRKLGRAQSVVSQTLANLEGQIGLSLFDRSGRYPVLTDAGQHLLAKARSAVGEAVAFKAHASRLAGGLEPELSVVFDVLFPIGTVTVAVTAFRLAFPSTPLRLHVEALGGVVAPVLNGQCAFGVAGSLPSLPASLTSEPLGHVSMGLVAAPQHPLAQSTEPLEAHELQEHVQLVLTDRTPLTQGREFGVLSSRTWRLSDLGAKHAFLKSGLGWGSMPLHLIDDDLQSGKLVRLEVANRPTQMSLAMMAMFPAEKPPGQAGRWLLDRLREDAGVLRA